MRIPSAPFDVQPWKYDKNLYAYCDNNPVMRKDEAVISVLGGMASGYVGGPGANQNMVLTNAIKTSMKTTGRMAARSCAKYAAKQIASTRSWRNNILSVSAWSSSIRFAMGTGISNGITNSWPDIKNWFSGLFK